MKKIISIFFSVLLVACFVLPVMASADSDTDKTDQGVLQSMFADKNSTNDIKNTIDNDQVFRFFDEQEVELNYNFVLPVFVPSNNNNVNKYRDTLEFSNSYVAPVSSVDGKLLGMVKLQRDGSSWVVGVFYESYNLQDEIEKLNIPRDTNTIFLENIFEDEFAVLSYKEGEESYYSLDNESRRGLNSDQLIKEAASSKTKYEEDAEGSGMSTNENVPHNWVFYTVPVALLFLLFCFIMFIKYRRKA